MKCVFCDIVKNKISSRKVYEDRWVVAFLDANPASPGHLLVIPKKHYKDIFVLPKNEFLRISVAVKKIVSAYKTAGIGNVNMMNASGKYAQQSVDHFHIHLVPRKKGDGLNMWFKKKPRKPDQTIYNKLRKLLR